MEPLPNWLAVMAEAAGMTAFTDEFDRTGTEWNTFNAPVPPIETLIGGGGSQCWGR